MLENLICAEWSREGVDNAEDGWELVVWMGSSQLDALDRSWKYLFTSPRVFLFGFILSLSDFTYICWFPLATLAHLYLNGILVFELYTFC